MQSMVGTKDLWAVSEVVMPDEMTVKQKYKGDLRRFEMLEMEIWDLVSVLLGFIWSLIFFLSHHSSFILVNAYAVPLYLDLVHCIPVYLPHSLKTQLRGSMAPPQRKLCTFMLTIIKFVDV